MTSPFTHEELVLIQIADQTSDLLGHHHHHHHHHEHGHDHGHEAQHPKPQLKIPEKLTTNLGLYALKKIDTINPSLLTVRQSRLLQPVTPGPITYFINAAFYISAGAYGVYIWRTRGLKGFASLAAIPFYAITLGRYATNEGLSYIRDYQYSIQRKNMVNDFTQRYGAQYLLSVLNPSFRL